MSHRLLTPIVFFGALALALGGLLSGRALGQEGGRSPQAGAGALGSSASVGSTFTYQGELLQGGAPADGLFDLRFILYNAPAGGAKVGPTVRVGDVAVSQGRFSVALDFGPVFTGDALWLAVAVRPGGSTGAYTPLSPRQALVAVPFALGLQPGAAISQPDAAPALTLGSGGDGLRVAPAGRHGLIVGNTGAHGLLVNQAGRDGVFVAEAADDGIQIGAAARDGVRVDAAGLHGIAVGAASSNGVRIDHAGGAGFVVCSTGSETEACPKRLFNSGLQVTAAEHFGVFVGSAGVHGIYVGLAGGDGVHVDTAEDVGLYVRSANADGLHLGLVGGNGIRIYKAGNASNIIWGESEGFDNNGLAVQGAEDHGLFVGRADNDGVQVRSAGDVGFYVYDADNVGVAVRAAANDAARFNGNVVITNGGCSGCLIAAFGVNAGEKELAPGDLVTVLGAEASAYAGAATLLQVAAVADGEAVVGVVAGSAEVVDAESSEAAHLVARHGRRAPAGAYVTIITHGTLQVRASSLEGASIRAGQRLAAAADGQARPLQEMAVALADGGTATMTEQAPTIGVALSEVDEKGMVWVLVNPQ